MEPAPSLPGSSQFRDPGNQHSPILQHNGGNTPSISGLSPEASPIPHTQRPQDSPMALPSEQDFSDSDSEAASAMQNAATSGHHSPLLQSGVPTPQPQDPSTPTDEQLSVRVLVDARTVGQIIGKGGATITSFRQASGALIEITKNDQNGVVHRIITVKGSVEPVCSALQMLADAQSIEPEPGTPTSYICLLVPVQQVGAVIGKGGSKINNTRTKSGAQVKVSDQTLENSTEKTVTIRGSSEQVHKAILYITYQLLESNVASVPRIPYTPSPLGYRLPGMSGLLLKNSFSSSSSLSSQRGSNGSTRVVSASSSPISPGTPAAPNGQLAALPPGVYVGQGIMVSGQEMSVNGSLMTLSLQLPEHACGLVIGKRGATINYIRAASGATVKIGNAISGQSYRALTITGTTHQNQSALNLIQSKLAAGIPGATPHSQNAHGLHHHHHHHHSSRAQQQQQQHPYVTHLHPHLAVSAHHHHAMDPRQAHHAHLPQHRPQSHHENHYHHAAAPDSYYNKANEAGRG